METLQPARPHVSCFQWPLHRLKKSLLLGPKVRDKNRLCFFITLQFGKPGTESYNLSGLMDNTRKYSVVCDLSSWLMEFIDSIFLYGLSLDWFRSPLSLKDCSSLMNISDGHFLFLYAISCRSVFFTHIGVSAFPYPHIRICACASGARKCGWEGRY